MGGVPSVPTDRTRSLQVIGAGYSRTGTVSMAMALETLLHGPVMHGGTQLLGREDAYAKLWCDIFARRHDKPVLMKLLREATAGFAGATDIPATMFLAELVELYPDAKVVLVTRDPARWFRSMEPIMRSVSVNPWILRVVLWPCPTWRWAPTWIAGMSTRENERLGLDWNDERLLRYNDWVREQVPPERLITMELSEGWAPLASFLDVPAPDVPFPRANDAEALSAEIKGMIVRAVLIWSGILAGTGAAAWGGWTLWKSS